MSRQTARTAFVPQLLVALVALPALALASPDAGTPPDPADAGVAEKARDPLADLPPAQPLSWKAALDKAEVGLAEPFSLTIEVRHAPTETYELSTTLDWKEFQLRDRKAETHGEEPKTTTIRLQLQAFDVGERELPGFRLLVSTPDGARQLEIPPQKIKVNGIIDPAQGEPKMRDDHRPLPRQYRTVWWPLLVALALGGLVGLLVWWRRRALRPPPPAPPTPRLPPHEEALGRLAALEAEALLSKGERQPYFFRLSDIVRDYLGRRFGFDALELTSDELLSELRGRPTPGLDFDALARFLLGADLVKFARRDPTDGESKAAMDEARAFVVRTVPPPAPTNGGAP